jgi:hypothetical protein
MPLPPEEISHYDLWCGHPDLTPTADMPGAYEIPAQGETNEHVIRYQDVLEDYGPFHCALRTVDTDGRRSGWSNLTAPLEWTRAPPTVPTNVLIITVSG